VIRSFRPHISFNHIHPTNAGVKPVFRSIAYATGERCRVYVDLGSSDFQRHVVACRGYAKPLDQCECNEAA
jgi:hypothetical protein